MPIIIEMDKLGKGKCDGKCNCPDCKCKAESEDAEEMESEGGEGEIPTLSPSMLKALKDMLKSKGS